ncbi:MAG: hypothetical protein KDA25_09090 [Phycisphaerales bacterium]|nr:hypothetical protein [Phycisphaerales bacterium]
MKQCLDMLGAVRTRFGPEAARIRLDGLERARHLDWRAPRRLRAYHDLLLFMAAHPDSAGMARLVDAELRRLTGVAASIIERGSGGPLEATGIGGTVIESTFSSAMTDWLSRRVPRSVEIAWEDGEGGRDLDELVAACLSPTERDGLIGGDLSVEDWIRQAIGTREQSTLRWVLDRLSSLDVGASAHDAVFNALELEVRWTLDEPACSRTLARFPARHLFAQRGALRRDGSARTWIGRALPSPRRLDVATREALLDAARITLLSRYRETDPVTHANEHDVTLYSLERGIDVALIGMRPERRLPLESYVGYVAARNRVPVAYGGAWIFLDRAEIGINVFDEFRGGESAFLFAQLLRVYHRHFDVRRFDVDPFQIGVDNEDAIRSGAYWFYDRFGFRSPDEAAARRADAERAALAGDRGGRTAKATLRRLAAGGLSLSIGARDAAPTPDVHALGLAVTRSIEADHGGDRAKAEARARRRLARLLGIGDRRRWSAAERASFSSLSPLVALVPGLETWSARDRRALVMVMRAKGGVREDDFIRRLRRHARLRRGLASVAAGATA